jgi:hypothetical protein
MARRTAAYALHRTIEEQEERAASHVAEHILRFRQIAAEELRSEESILGDTTTTAPCIGIAARPEPYRTYYLTYARLEPIFEREGVDPPLVIETPRGRGLTWRVRPDEFGVVLFTSAREGGGVITLEEKVTFLRGEEARQIRYVLDQIVLNPPKFS